MLKLFIILKDKNYDQFFEGTFEQFEDCYFSFPDASSLENKIAAVKSWATDNSYSVEIKDGSKVYA